MPAPRLELSRPYFEREARFGRRVIFRWTPATRWTERPCPGGQYDDQPDWCPRCRDVPMFEGVNFIDAVAAQAFDLEQIYPVGEDGCWAEFDTWEDAEHWLRGES